MADQLPHDRQDSANDVVVAALVDPNGNELEQRAHQAWQLAIEGREQDAYAQLKALSGEGITDDVFQQLYWLLRLNADLDPDKSPVDWLVEGLLANRITGSMCELYQREIERDPVEATSDRMNRLLDMDAAPTALASLLKWRWRALDNSQHALVVEDLHRVQNRFVMHDDDTWQQLVLTAMHHVGWASNINNNESFAQCREMLENGQAKMPDDFERLLEILEAWSALRKHARIPNRWLDLMVVASTQFERAWIVELESVIEQIARDPKRSFARLDLLMESCPSAAKRFCTIVAEHFERTRRNNQAEGYGRMVQRLFALRTYDYQQFREILLGFCIHEMLSPQLVAMIVSQDETFAAENWADKIHADVTLHTVWMAHASFYG